MKTFSILDYGAAANTGKLYTKEIQAAIDAASENNGGTVIIPAGEFVTGTLNLRNASLHLEKGAVLKGSPRMEDYIHNGYIHNELGNCLSLIYSLNHDDILISGEGTIDLNGDSFFDMARPIIPETRVPMTEKQKEECTRSFEERPTQPIFFYNCNHIHVKDIRIINAPCWTMTFVESEDIRVTGLTIDNSLILPNNDGIHICSCKNVLISGCKISSGDDCIAMTAITDWNKPCEDIVISDCILRSCSKAIVAGYMHSIVRNILITNCIIKESNRPFAIMSSRTGLVENIMVSNMRLDTQIRAGNWWGNGEAICIMGTYHAHESEDYEHGAPDHSFSVNIRNLSFQNIACTTENVIAVVGEGDNVRDIHFNGLFVDLKESKNLMLKGPMVDLSPGEQKASVPDDKPYWLHLQGVRDIIIDNAFVSSFQGNQPEISVKECKNIRVNGVEI